MPDRIYEETIFSRINAAIFAVITGSLLFILIFQLFVGPLGSKPASNVSLVFMIVLFSVCGIMFSRLAITINSRGVVVGYGIIKQLIPWDNIEDCYLDRTSAVYYGGWGIRLRRAGGKWRIIYNVLEAPRVVLSLKEGWQREIAFSTRQPQKIISIVTGRNT